MESSICYINYETSANTTGPPLPSREQFEEKAQNSRRSRCLALMTVCLGLICVVLLVDTSMGILQFIIITADRDLIKRYKNTVEELSQTINSLQDNNTDLTRKKLELERNITSLSYDLQESYEKGYLWGSGWFFISNGYMSWSESRQFCRNQGADLVVINTEEKQKFITSLVNGRMWPMTTWQEGLWIGLTDKAQEGMKWVDNSSLIHGFWVPGEPNDQYGSEDCVELMSSFPVLNWIDLPCYNVRKCICER